MSASPASPDLAILPVVITITVAVAVALALLPLWWHLLSGKVAYLRARHQLRAWMKDQ